MYLFLIGSGLGAQQNGITEPVKASKKFNTNGLGHKEVDVFQWWDHAFNKAAKAFDIKVNEDEVVLEKKLDMGQIKTTKHVFVGNEEDLRYGGFHKSGTLTNGITTACKQPTVREEKDYSSKISDEELFKRCGGLTAHKYLMIYVL